MSIAHGFGMKILGYDLYPPKEDVKKLYDAEMVTDINRIYKECDYISLHVNLTNENYHMINKETLALMKPNCVIINTGRGQLVSVTDLLPFLRENKIGGYVADVYEKEGGVYFFDRFANPPNDPELKEMLMLNNVLLTPH